MNNFNTPAEIVEAQLKGGETKVSLPLYKMILLGIMAGAFIALGGATSSTAAHNISNIGLQRLVAGCIFPVGLMIIVFVGGELFTGNCMTVMGVLDGRYKVSKIVKCLITAWLSNLVGALIVDVLIFCSGNLDFSSGLLGAYTIKVAVGKTSISFLKGITSGILCNILVCIAILMATASRDIAGKVLAIFFPIMAFVVGGFEHCVANMFYIPAGMLAATNETYVQKAMEVYGLTEDAISSLSLSGFFQNQIPVTIGNIIGGMVFVALPCYLAHSKKQTKSSDLTQK